VLFIPVKRMMIIPPRIPKLLMKFESFTAISSP
jgi:hypothetical protein